MLEVQEADLITESDVEQKLLMPLLRDVFGFNNIEILTKDYLAPTQIDKGAGKKVGYYPDYQGAEKGSRWWARSGSVRASVQGGVRCAVLMSGKGICSRS